MTRLRFLLLLFFAISSPNAYAQTAVSAMTYNIRYDNPSDGENNWHKRKEWLAAQIRFYDPDLFGIQEGLKHQVDFLVEKFPEYGWVGIGRDDGLEAGEYCALFYRKSRFDTLATGTFWLSETPDAPSTGWDAALPRICTFALLQEKEEGLAIQVFNTHFDHRGQEARIRSAALLRTKWQALREGAAASLIMGDFNCRPGEAPYREMTAFMQDTRDCAKEGPFGPDGTFNGFDFSKPVKDRIDYLFIEGDGGVLVQKHAILSDSKNNRYPSDHLPVYVKFLIGKSR